MIQIYTDKIAKWEEIKENHAEFVKKVIRKYLNKITKQEEFILEIDDVAFIRDIFNCKYENGEFVDEDSSRIRVIAIGKIEEIEKIFKPYILNDKKKKILKYIIKYNEIYSNNYRDNLLKEMNIKVCPYCNMETMYTYYDKQNKTDKNTGEIDHYYPKSEYPQYALSIYNFIPSCTKCNAKIKTTKSSIGTLYPYEEGYNTYDAKFNIKPTRELIEEGTKIPSLEKHKFEIIVDTENNKVIKSKNLFKTEALYSADQCKERVQEIRRKITEYTPSRLEEISKILGKELKHKQFILDKTYCESEEEMINKSFSKFENDIYEKYCQWNGSLGDKN